MSPAFQIRTYEGSWGELADFVYRVWSHNYAGKMTFPGWTAEYLEWQLGAEADRRHLLAAYQGERLIGVLLGMRSPLRHKSTVIPATQWSWLSVAPECRGNGIAKQLDDERVRRSRDCGDELILSYRYVGSRHSLAERPNPHNANKQFHSKVGFWARILDPDRFANWHYSRLEGNMARWFRGLSPRISAPGDACHYSIREIADSGQESPVTALIGEEGIVGACDRFLRSVSEQYELSPFWERPRLERQLIGSPLSHTLLQVKKGAITGLLNYHILPFHGRNTEPVAIIDLLAISPHGASVSLLQSALTQMKAQGAILALKLRTGDTPTWSMWRTGFLPQPVDSFLVFQWVNRPQSISKRGPLQLLWR